MIQTTTYDDTLYQLVPKSLPFDTEMRPVIARMCRKVEGGACILFDDFWNDLLSAAPTPPAQPAYPPDDGPLTDKQIDAIRRIADTKTQPVERKPLTDEDITKIAMGYWLSWEGNDIVRFARHIILSSGITEP